MTTRLLIGDVFERMAELPDGSFDLIVTSPPFLALRSYLPDGHPDKAKEIGSEPTPADYLDTLLALTAEWRRLLAPHGSLAVELGDTYAGSGGAGGDYNEDGLREGQPLFDGSERRRSSGGVGLNKTCAGNPGGNGWPLDKSLTGIPTLYAWSLAYGRNLLTGEESPAGRWRVRNLKPWIRSNPPVGALGDKERPATSYITVACTGSSRWFDLDAVRTRPSQDPATYTGNGYTKGRPEGIPGNEAMAGNPGGAPPLDWWHPIDALIDDELNQRAKEGPRHAYRGNGKHTDSPTASHGRDLDDYVAPNRGANGTHIRRRLERAGYLTPQDFYDISPKGYAGAHYAVWPPELVRHLIDEMCPRRVCITCGMPSMRLTETTYGHDTSHANGRFDGEKYADKAQGGAAGGPQGMTHGRAAKNVTTVGWSDCGHGNWRPGRICDPFVGSGTTLAVASGMGRDSIGIDLDERSADLCRERVGMFLEVDYPTWEVPA